MRDSYDLPQSPIYNGGVKSIELFQQANRMERTSSTDQEYRPSFSQTPTPGYAAAAPTSTRRGPPTSAIERQLARETLRASATNPPRTARSQGEETRDRSRRWPRKLILIAVLVLLALGVTGLYQRPDLRTELRQSVQLAESWLQHYWHQLGERWERSGPATVKQQRANTAAAPTATVSTTATAQAPAERYQRAEEFLRDASAMVPELQSDPRFKTLLAEMEAAARRSGQR